MSVFFSRLVKIIKAKWIFEYPKKSKIIVFDSLWSEYMSNFFRKKEVEVLCTRYEEINIPILIKCLIKKNLSSKSYYKEFIESVNPKLIITFIDNAKRFWEIHKITKIKTAFVQTGMRCHLYENNHFKKIFNSKLKKKLYRVNHMFVLNKHYGKKYNSFIKGDVHIIGSFKSNIFKILKKKKKKEICYISCYRHKPNDFPSGIKYSTYSKNYEYFFYWLREYIIKNKIKLNIIGKNYGEHGNYENKYFTEIFDKTDFKFYPANKKRLTYKLIDSFKFVFTTDSTLGIENLSRGGRTGFIGNTPNIYPISTRKFAWNENLNSKGLFWTDENNYKEFNRVFKFVIKGSETKWLKLRKKYRKIMTYDKGNRLFKKIIFKSL